MNPIKNKKDLDTKINELRNVAYAYLEKYNPSKQQLRTYLVKKFLKKKCKNPIFSNGGIKTGILKRIFLAKKFINPSKLKMFGQTVPTAI